MAIVNEEIKGTNGSDTLFNDKKGYTYMAGLEDDDTYIIKNISKSFTELDDADRLDESDNPDPVNSNGIPTAVYGYDTVQINNIKANDLMLFFDVSLNDKNEDSAPADELYIIRKNAINSILKQTMKLADVWDDLEEDNPSLSEDQIEKLALEKAAPQSGAVYIPNQFGDINNGGSQPSAGAIENIQLFEEKTKIVKTLDMDSYISKITSKVMNLLNEINELGLENYNGEKIQSAYQLINSKHTTYKNKLFNIYKSETIDITIEGSTDDDKLTGEKGKNTFVFDNNSGHDTIIMGKGQDVIRFKDIDSTLIRYTNSRNDLIINYNNGNSSVTIKNYLSKPEKSSIKTLEFVREDGTLEHSVNLLDEAFIDIEGVLNKKNNLKGTSIDDEINGGNLDDVIKAGKGDDILNGGTGNDKLYGEAGNNTFDFSDGDGKDILYMGKGVDKIVFDSSVTDSNDDPVFIRNKNNLEIRYGSFDENGERNSVTVANYFKSKYQSVQKIEINGEEYNLKDIVIEGEIINHNGISCKNFAVNPDIVENNNLIYMDYKNNFAEGGYGDDLYHITSLKNNSYISDTSGDDRLIINEKASNINVLFDIYNDGSIPASSSDNAIIIMNDANLKKFKKTGALNSINSRVEIARNESAIEEIYSRDGKVINLEQLQSSVASWLLSNGYDSAMQVLTNEQKPGDLEVLLSVYQDAWTPLA